MKLFILGAALWGACGSWALAATLHVDDFQTGLATLGWAGGAAPTRIADGGPGGAGDAYLRISAGAGGHLATYNEAAAWVGDWGASGATAVTVDLMSPATSAPLAIRLVLFGPTSTFDRWTSVSAQSVPSDGVWRSYSFAIGPGDITRVIGGGTYEQLRASTLRVMLRHNPGSPSATGPPVASPGGMLNIDNITLAGSAEPLVGDFNHDGLVDAADLNDPTAGWQARFGTDVDGGDFLEWQRNFGPAGAAAAAASVPEPAAILLGAGLCLGCWRLLRCGSG
ncbi:MAG: hypothetical protein IT424_03905 [Pirellulales bacterium]|nr:hypothetical protein [Pirellulales bacterium]